MNPEPGPHVPDLILEQYRLGELPREEVDRLERQLRADPALGERLAALDRSDDELARQYPPDWLARRVRDRMPARGTVHGVGLGRLVLASALTIVALAMVVARPWSGSEPIAGDDMNDRIKGPGPTLAVYRRTPQGSEALADGAPARTGDLLRLGYVAAGRGYGAILSIDRRGVVTQHLPPNGTRAAALRGGGTILLEQAYELDDAPEWERFYFVTADYAFEVAPVVEAARRAAAQSAPSPPDALPIPLGLGQSTFSIQKEVRP